ncbi:SRPBCC family protein [Bacillus sp. FJAT-49732]|uniref:SRPBCC family protein n=1 Tax=Lederbergia citrisecunda TaxID=2833583 RepID=A0A942TR62_9BACI|nr:SRPBCC family protein [Lederbergia citrisecunda]MBS4201833.1 SRPBCC family protein [Lederbergia citrisecunda]
MLAKLQKTDQGYLAQFNRNLNHPVEDVWAMLTDNDKLAQWFPELRVKDLREGGAFTFNMGEGNLIEMPILEFKMHSELEFTWADDVVRFELHPEAEGCQLILKEKINKMTDHTPRDLAGWHVCLDVISALLDRKTIENRKAEWEKWYPKYVEAVDEITQS